MCGTLDDDAMRAIASVCCASPPAFAFERRTCDSSTMSAFQLRSHSLARSNVAILGEVSTILGVLSSW